MRRWWKTASAASAASVTLLTLALLSFTPGAAIAGPPQQGSWHPDPHDATALSHV